MTPAGHSAGGDEAGSSSSLAWRAATALVLMAGFYILALGIAAALCAELGIGDIDLGAQVGEPAGGFA
jgi:hypothetical protein